jgi:hypothetical protein
MERMTVRAGDGYNLTGDYSDEDAVQRLGHYENAHMELVARQVLVEQELEKLRAEGRQKSGRFKELIARKLVNQSILDLLEA